MLIHSESIYLYAYVSFNWLRRNNRRRLGAIYAYNNDNEDEID